MAIKKSELYGSLWKSCDALRGGMDASQYKDYVLVVLFVKYVSDKARAGRTLLTVPEGGSFSDLLALRNDPEIGDKTNKVIAKLAAENDLQGIIDLADFNDPEKLGRGKDMVERLSELFAIFDRPELDFGANAAEGDDLLGDAYEYLMRNFASESGKSKGQFYTPAEVSRILAKVVSAGSATSSDQTIYDPTCGSGSLLLKAHAEAQTTSGLDLAVYGQEMDNATAALSKMNMILHGVEGAEIWQDNTLSSPHFKNPDGSLMTFDFVVANPPFSTKSWSTGVSVASDPFDRFKYGTPPPKNGDYAFLLHILASLKSTGKAAVILPLGVLFRGNAEATIRRELVRRGLLKAVIALPSNLFYGTGIPAAILILDKEDAGTRSGIFMINASRGFAKDGNKNRLRERDIHRIVDTYSRFSEITRYSRFVTLTELADPKNDYNLNVARYIDVTDAVVTQDLSAHLRGGIPKRDVDDLDWFWTALPGLRDVLYLPKDSAYLELKSPSDQIAATLAHSEQWLAAVRRAGDDCAEWIASAGIRLGSITSTTHAKQLGATLADSLLLSFAKVPLIDEYAIYQSFTTYWSAVMSDDISNVVANGWLHSATPVVASSDDKDEADYVNGKVRYRSAVLPASVLRRVYFSSQEEQLQAAIEAEAVSVASLDDLVVEHSGEDGVLAELVGDNGKIAKKVVQDRLKTLGSEDDAQEEGAILRATAKAFDELDAARKRTKSLSSELNELVKAKYESLSEEDILNLVVEEKWLAEVRSFVTLGLEAVLRRASDEIALGAARYATPLPDLLQNVDVLGREVDQLLAELEKGKR